MWEDAKQAIRNSSPESSVYIGCDSVRFKKNDKWFARYATVIVVHRDSRHGCQVFHHTETLPDYGGLKNRLMTEVNYGVTAAMDIVDELRGRHLEVHLDLNPDPKHKSNVATKEAIGWVLGMGFEPKIKPDGWAATHAADHCARSKTFAH